MKVNALKPRVLVSKVRKSISDPECFTRSPWPHHQSSPQGASLAPPLSPKPATQVKAFLWENDGVAQLGQICPSFLWSERVLKEHQCSNAATFPVYKPPATLPGMVSGLRRRWGKASGQMDNKAVWLIHYLQILKVVDLGRKGIKAGKSARWGVWETLSYVFSARGLQVVGSQEGHSQQEPNMEKGEDLGKWFF